MTNISKLILKAAGWKTVVAVEEPSKSVICVAPHTSNWDLIMGKLAYWSVERKASFLIKKSWFFFPMNLFFNAIGGVAVDRTKKNSVTQQMVDEFNARESFHLAITPEGTRKLVDDWKMGFYYIALGANVPIQIAYIDFAKKEVGIKALFYPTGDEKTDIETIKSFYKGITGKFPERFNL